MDKMVYCEDDPIDILLKMAPSSAEEEQTMNFKLFINDDAQNIFVVSKSNKVVAQWSQSVSKKVSHTTKAQVETADR